eukprot:g14077.t1
MREDMEQAVQALIQNQKGTQPAYIDLGKGKCGSTIGVSTGCGKEIKTKKELLALAASNKVKVTLSKLPTKIRSMRSTPSPFNETNLVCVSCYNKELTYRKKLTAHEKQPDSVLQKRVTEMPDTPGTVLQKQETEMPGTPGTVLQKRVTEMPDMQLRPTKISRIEGNDNKIRSCQQLIQRDLAALTSIFG